MRCERVPSVVAVCVRLEAAGGLAWAGWVSLRLDFDEGWFGLGKLACDPELTPKSRGQLGNDRLGGVGDDSGAAYLAR